MKKITLIFLMALMFNIAYSQETTEEVLATENPFNEYKNTLSLSPFSILIGEAKLTFERKFTKKNSLLILGSLIHNENSNYTGVSLGASGEIHYRKYLVYSYLRKKKNPDSKNTVGFYISPFAGYQYLEGYNNNYTYPVTRGNLKSHTNAVQFGLLTGLNLNLIKGRLHLDFYTGFAEKISFNSTGNISNGGINSLQYGKTGIIPKANLQLGFNF